MSGMTQANSPDRRLRNGAVKDLEFPAAVNQGECPQGSELHLWTVAPDSSSKD